MEPLVSRLLTYEGWANERALRSAEASGNERDIRLAAHLVAAQLAWLERLRGAEQSGTPVWPEWSAAETRAMLERANRELGEYARTLTPSRLLGSITYRNSAGREFTSVVADVLTHLLTHGSYHRGQVAQAVRSAGGEPASTDFIVFAREAG
ncbi:MAG TPA: DinB family protein [Deinococcales bacterium]|nr:DinB family protein [Deinococcales bacterium]